MVGNGDCTMGELLLVLLEHFSTLDTQAHLQTELDAQKEMHNEVVAPYGMELIGETIIQIWIVLIEDDVLDMLGEERSLEWVLLRIVHSRLWNIDAILHLELLVLLIHV